MVVLHTAGTWLLLVSLRYSLGGTTWLFLGVASDFILASFFFPVVAFVLQLRKYCRKFSSKITSTFFFFMGCCVLENSSTKSARERKTGEIVTYVSPRRRLHVLWSVW